MDKNWECEQCNYNKNEVSLLKCNKCNSFSRLIDVIKDQLIYSLDKSKYDNNESFVNILKLFKNKQFIKYHSLIKLENLLLYTINLIIFMNKIDLLKILFDNKV